ncbi:protein SOSEKI 2-like [Impatiens glandulifera]|uniref:protein SOSEKI 2-like n=1 Tax=Impatiens glandulifera TaxID=253017 RepID=UPI001FB15814|nr:protein SOSEKI 2-like [Impatiens glandulifera]
MENGRSRTETKVMMMMKEPPTPTPTPLRKVQIVYYLSKNGQLEHPHFMEVSHFAHHPLRLKDVMDRLMILRGNAMPSLYSWSCKRSYKNGYVWNDLGENDVVYPSEPEGGAEYILKGSEIHLQPSSSSTQKIQQNDVSPRPMQQVTADQVTGIYPKRTTQHAKRHTEPQEVGHYSEEEEENYDDQYEDEKQKAKSNRSSKETSTELTRHLPKPTLSPIYDSEGSESILSRNSVLFQLISCVGGGAAAIKGSRIISSPAVVTSFREKNGNNNNLHKEVLRNRASAAAAAELEDKMIIRCMSENPRFGNLQSEEKEYFSGSIVESMISKEERVKSVELAQLKKSSSYNEERSGKSGLGETEEELQKGPADKVKKDEMKKREKVVKCIPKMRSSCTKQPNKKK